MDIPHSITVEEIRMATPEDEHLGILSQHVLCGWPSAKAVVQKKLIHHFVKLHKYEHSNVMKVVRKDTIADDHTIEPPRHVNLEKKNQAKGQ